MMAAANVLHKGQCPAYALLFSSNNHNNIIRKTSENYEFRKYVNNSSSFSRSCSFAMATMEEMPRPVTKNLKRSPWAEDSFSSDSDEQQLQEKYAEDIEVMKEKVRNMVMDTKNSYTARDKMVLIDTLERLGIAYHFEQEIEQQLRQIFMELFPQDGDYNTDEYDLFTTALYFRMFRQHGFEVSSSVFAAFKDEDNMFKKALCNDIEGLLSLYEASFLRFHEEIELQEARDFATHHLNKAQTIHLQDSSYLKEKVNRALMQPIHWALPKLEARYYISIYEKKESKDEMLLRLAKLDFHVMQDMYKKEMHQVQKWWYSFDLVSRLPYARDCVVPSYFWASALSYEPKYSRSRIAATKVFVIGTLFNDTYDSYATLEEAEALTDLMQRLDAKDIDKLPKYMKIVYDALLHALGEFENETSSEKRTSCMFAYLKETFRQMAAAFHMKMKWYNGQERPMFQDHVASMGITSGLHQMLAAFYIHDESASSDVTFNWLASKPSSVEHAALYCRYLNDICSYQREREAGNYPTSVDCYMEENGFSIEETKEKFAEFAEDCWMTLNKEWIEAKCVPKENLKPVINFCRVIFAIYGYGSDLFSHPEDGLVASIDALLLDHVAM